MSGESNQDDAAGGAPEDAQPKELAPDESGVIQVEVEPPDPPVNELEVKLAAAEKEKKDNWDRYLRAAADLENQRKRQKREIEDTKFETKSRVLKEMLPVVDNLERAIEHAGGADTDPALRPIVEGVQLVLRQFQTAFERLDITPVEAAGQAFDPNLHEAISQQDSDAPAGTIVQVLQRGYKTGDKLLRPALVVVAKAKASPE